MAAAKSQINLLPVSLRESEKYLSLQRLLKRLSFVLISIYFVVFILLFVFLFVLTRRIEGLRAGKDALVDQLESLTTEETLLKTIKNRAAVARKVFTSAKLPDELVESVLLLVPSEIAIVGIETQEQKVILTAITQNVSAVSNFFKALENSNFSMVFLKNLSSTPESYGFSIEIQ